MSIVPPAKSTRGGAEDSIIIAIDFFVEIRYQDRTTSWSAPAWRRSCYSRFTLLG